MCRSGIAQRELKRDFGMGLIRLINGRDIWLALDDSHEDSRRIHLDDISQLQPLSIQEADSYYRQLFRWRLRRTG